MSKTFKVIALLAVVGIVFVLITPAADELPCTARHGAPLAFALPLSVISVHVNLNHGLRLFGTESVPLCGKNKLLFFTCTLLC